MSGVKFNCPHCRQHILCDSDYASLGVDCPSCGARLIVPRRSGGEPPPPEAGRIASPPPPNPPPVPPPAPSGSWTKAEWARYYDEVAGTAPHPAPSWMLAAFGTLTLAVVLRANHVNLWLLIVVLIIGAVITGVLAARNKTKGATVAQRNLRILAYAFGAALLLPVIALGLIFLGCTVCR